ncbi:MAG: hypothetical protein WA842_11145 [Croceibacterium sp.]
MLDFALAHAVHVLSVILWIGGVGFVTLVLIPALGRTEEATRMARFQELEGRFAPQARLWVALAGGSGLWMVWRGDMWSRFADPQFWWMHAMVVAWLPFALMLFVLEPLVLHRRMRDSKDPAGDFRRLRVTHQVLLALSLLAAFGAAAGAHGF